MLLNFRFSKTLFLRRLLVVLIAIGFLGITPQSIAYSSAPDQKEQIPRFEERKCKYVFPLAWWEGVDQSRFRCGYLVTWENYNIKNENKTIWLSVMQTYAGPWYHSRDPVIWLAGGPGASGFQRLPADAIKQADGWQRGYIQLSQRGSYLSQADLKCPEYQEAILANWMKPEDEQAFGWDEWSALQATPLQKCAKRLGADYLVSFNSKFNAWDVIYLIQALEYEKAYLYGGSYGSLLAQHVLVLSPKNVTGVVLVGVAPLSMDWIAEQPLNMQNDLQQIFDTCGSSSACREAYPKLKQSFFDLLDRLKTEHLCYVLADGPDKHPYVCLDDYGFLLALQEMLYYTKDVEQIPRIIDGVSNYDSNQIKILIEKYYTVEMSEDLPWGMYYSIYCTEFAGYDTDRIDITQLEQEFKDLYAGSKQLINKICPTFDPSLRAYGNVGIDNNKKPVLIINGRFDPVTPLKYGEQVKAKLNISDGFIFTSEKRAHNSDDSFCAGAITKKFFYAPETSPKDECWDREEKQPIEFLLPGEVTPETEVPEVPGQPEPQKPNSDIPGDWIQAFNNLWQKIQDLVKLDPNKLWEDLQKQLNEALNKLWEDFQKNSPR